MASIWSKISLVSVAAGLIGLDASAVGQFMVSRPLVASVIVGFLLNNPGAGLTVGILMELIWLGRLPIGTSVPPDVSTASVVATGIAVILNSPVAIVLAMFVGILVARIGGYGDELVRHANDWVSHMADRFAQRGDIKGFVRLHWISIAFYLFETSLLAFAGVSLGVYIVGSVGDLLPVGVGRGVGAVYTLLLILGFSVVLDVLRTKGSSIYFVLSFAGAYVMSSLLRVPPWGVVLVSIAGGIALAQMERPAS
ncbi:MAG: PTS sugar transporter subunit IIC [bacterium]